MKALLATTFAALLVAMAVIAHATPAPVLGDIESPLPSDDKDKDKDKKEG